MKVAHGLLRVRLVTLIAVLSAWLPNETIAKELYFIALGNVFEHRIDGNIPRLVAAFEPHCRHTDVSVSSVAGAVYWAQSCAGGPTTIYRKRIGQPSEVVVNVDGTYIYSLCVDDSTRSIFYGIHRLNPSEFVIRAANLDGTNVRTLVRWDLPSHILGIDVDPVDRMIYWSSLGGQSISRTKLDGVFPPEELVSGRDGVSDLVVDSNGGKMYWGAIVSVGGDSLVGRIERANLDGAYVETIFEALGSTPSGLAIDAGTKKLYWADEAAGVIWRSELDGSMLESVLEEIPGVLRVDVGSLHSVAIDKSNWGQFRHRFRE